VTEQGAFARKRTSVILFSGTRNKKDAIALFVLSGKQAKIFSR